jgi:hypothetical protein
MIICQSVSNTTLSKFHCRKHLFTCIGWSKHSSNFLGMRLGIMLLAGSGGRVWPAGRSLPITGLVGVYSQTQHVKYWWIDVVCFHHQLTCCVWHIHLLNVEITQRYGQHKHKNKAWAHSPFPPISLKVRCEMPKLQKNKLKLKNRI